MSVDPKSRFVDADLSVDGKVYHVNVGVEGETRDGRPTIHNVQFDIVPAQSASLPQILTYYNVTLMNPRVLCGLFVGVMLVFVFCAMTMDAVGRAAFSMMQECRRQFGIMKEAFRGQGMSEEDIKDPLKWPFSVEAEGMTYPDYANCVAISTAGAQREMVVPSLLAVIVPIVVAWSSGSPGPWGCSRGPWFLGLRWRSSWPMPAGRGTTRRSTSKPDTSAGRARPPTRPGWSVTPSAIRSRTRPARASIS